MRSRDAADVLTLKTVTFSYDVREDRILAAINAGMPDAWSCWLTRRIALALLERAEEFVANTSTLVKQAPSALRGEFVEFEREAAIASTAPAMSKTPGAILKTSAVRAELAEWLTLSVQRNNFRFELHGHEQAGAAGMLKRSELQRILQMLQAQVAKGGWMAAPAQHKTATAAEDTVPKPLRN